MGELKRERGEERGKERECDGEESRERY